MQQGQPQQYAQQPQQGQQQQQQQYAQQQQQQQQQQQYAQQQQQQQAAAPAPQPQQQAGQATFNQGQMPDFQAIEDKDGVRFSWNVWPTSKVDAARIVVPLGCLYTPLKETVDLHTLPYEPIQCKKCTAVLSPYARCDYHSKVWVCPYCFNRNQFPPHYADISETKLPAELIPSFTTIEYTLRSRAAAPPPVFLYVVDTVLGEGEMGQLREQLIKSLSLLPPTALVGLITFGNMVNVYELGYETCAKAFTFKGDKAAVTPAQINQLLQQPGQGAQQASAANKAARFLLPVSDCFDSFYSILEELQRDGWPAKPEERAPRSTGVAVSCAVSLLEVAHKNLGARVMLFLGGPCTQGPGQCVDKSKEENIRGHHDMEKDNNLCRFVAKATKFYDEYANKCVANGHIVDIYSCALDQCTVMEMRRLVNLTGGYFVISEAFEHPTFKNSLTKSFDKSEDSQQLKMGFCAQLDVITSREFKVSGAIGPCASLNKKSGYVAETAVGIGGTSAWRICGLDAMTTIGLYFECANAQAGTQPQGPRYFQFITRYQAPSGEYRMRVTSLCYPWASVTGNPQQPLNNNELANGFDQDAAVVLMARLATFKTESEEAFEILRWLDRMLIRLCSKFGDYKKDEAASFQLNMRMSIYPQFMFHLRRSKFLQVFNSSPDETAWFRSILMRADVGDSLCMIQPTLMSYGIDTAPQPALLDGTSIQPDKILMLDTYFYVIIFHGDTVAKWRKAGYHKMVDEASGKLQYETFAKQLEAPINDAEELLADRHPHPRFVDCDQFGSQARFLLSSLNPSTTHNSGDAMDGGGGGEVLNTDDVSLQVFMDHLKGLAVTQQQA